MLTKEVLTDDAAPIIKKEGATEFPVSLTLRAGNELAFDALCALAAHEYAQGVSRLDVERMRTRVRDVLETACKLGIADGTSTYDNRSPENRG